MALKQYILTIDESAMTDELRHLLESKGAEVHEEPIEELDLPEEEAQQILKRIEEFEQGHDFKTWQQVEEEVQAYRTKRKAGE